MRLPPWSVISSWPQANYTNPQTRGNALLVVNVIFSSLVISAVCGRYYARIVVKRWYGWDDAMMVPAFIAAVGLNIAVVLANRKFGWDRHVWDLPYSEVQGANIIAFAAKELFVVACTFTRLSLTFFYFRLIKDSGINWFKWVLYACLVFNIAIGITFFALGIWLCVPVRSYWVFPPTGNYHCMSEGTVLLVAGIINCVADLLTTTVPIPLVMKLKMPLKQRIGVCFLLGLGFAVTIAGILRTYFIWKSLIDSWDETWYSYPLWICAAVEIDVAVICACAPALKSLFHARIARITTRISEKLGSLRTPDQSSGVHSSSDASHSAPRSFTSSYFRGKRPQVSVCGDGDEASGMLPQINKSEHPFMDSHELEQQQQQRIEPPNLHSGVVRSVSKLGRLPPLEIMRRQSVDQESSYVRATGDTSRSNSEAYMNPHR